MTSEDSDESQFMCVGHWRVDDSTAALPRLRLRPIVGPRLVFEYDRSACLERG